MVIKLFIIIASAYPHAKWSLKYAHGCVMLIVFFFWLIGISDVCFALMSGAG
jgi:uncharacterized membrane protein